MENFKFTFGVWMAILCFTINITSCSEQLQTQRLIDRVSKIHFELIEQGGKR